jgi:S1-C subfamily serine protease
MLRYRILPRSVIGISMLILAFAVGAGFSGVVLYSYYQYHLNQTDSKVNALISGYKSQFAKAEADLASSEAAAKAQIADQAHNAQSALAGPAEIASLTKQVSPSVFFVHTQDAAGQPSVGTAFVVSSNNNQTLLLTSYTTIAAATHAPAPGIYVTQGDASAQMTVTLSTWDPQYDMALLILPKSGLPPMTIAATSATPQPGDRLFAVSGLGTAGVSLTQGSVIDVSSGGLQLDAAIGTSFQGGPVVNQSGQVIAVASRSYAPDGFSSSGVYFVPYVQAACNKVLSCPGGTLTTGR